MRNLLLTTALFVSLSISDPFISSSFAAKTLKKDDFPLDKIGLLLNFEEQHMVKELLEEKKKEAENQKSTKEIMNPILDLYNSGNFQDAFQEVLPLARLGVAEAQEMIGIMYRMGQGVTVDEKRAITWLNKAARQNRALAQHHLGIMYYQGKTANRDTLKALTWLNVAVDNYEEGVQKEQAISDRNNIAARLTRTERRSARKKANNWKTDKSLKSIKYAR